jgi:hypothetical protein
MVYKAASIHFLEFPIIIRCSYPIFKFYDKGHKLGFSEALRDNVYLCEEAQ